MSASKRILSIGMRGYDISSLHCILSLLGFDISKEEVKKNLFGNSTESAIKQIQHENNLDQTGIVDEQTLTSLYDYAKDQGFYSVKGMIATRLGLACKGLQVFAIDRNQGKDSPLGKSITDDTGNYVILYKRENFVHNGKQNADIQIKIVDLDDETKLYGVSSVHFNANHDERINIILNDIDKVHDKRSEYSQIFNDLNMYILNTPLRDLKENIDRQDISYLSGKTGWDARLVAMVSLSDKYSNESQIEPSFYYALFRSGVSTNANELYKTNSEIVKKIWNKAINDRIIDLSLKSRINRNIQFYKRKQKSYLLEDMKPSGVSSLKHLLSLSISKDEEKQKQFVDLYFNNSDKGMEKFWAKVENQFGIDTMKKLQLDSKLGYLTMNNANLIKKLESASFKINDPADLIKKGFYNKEKWQALFATNQIPIPQEIPGENEQEKKENYVEHMTLLLKKSYPTLVVAEMIKNDELKVNDRSVRDEIYGSLNSMYEKLEFQIGTQPIEKVLKDNPATIKLGDRALKELKKIQRIYQLTPSDETMKVLWANNLTSALSIVQYDKNEFVDTFGKSFGGPEITSTIYSKAHQVHSTVLNLATACMTYKANPRIYALSQMIDTEDSEPPIIDNPTLEELFGSLDYYECDHCQSVLSPASYFVDLLQFINLKKYDSDGNELPPTYEKENPLDVLLSKRPDLEHIQLTCENTNTILPYIDLVNEILEYYVVNRSIAGFEGFNTQDITTIELLANPQFVNEQAYTILKNQVYPFNLPFNRSLEYLRLLYNHLKIELNDAMEKLRVNEDLDGDIGVNPKPYAWREIYNEFLGISPQEYRILTNSLFKKLPSYFGEDENMPFDEFRNKLSNAKVFARKTDITYRELIELVSTKFINPDKYLIPKIQKLAVSFADIKGFIDGTISEADFNEKIPSEIKEQEQENPQYGGDILQWVRDNHQKIMNLIVLTFLDSDDTNRGFDKLELRYSLPDKTSNHLKEIDFWCLFRFIRLWKKLGWTIEETDKVITALYKKEFLPKTGTNDINKQKQNLDKGLKDLIIKVAHLRKTMGKLNLKRSKLIEALSLWSNIDVQGKNSLYSRMFLSSSVSKIDDVFNENGSGEYLQDEEQKIRGHIGVLQAAFNLNIKDISIILEDAGLTYDSKLSLENISKIYRYSFLARCLKLGIEELIMMKRMSGVDPFAELKDVNPDILEFIDLVKLIRDSKFKTDTLNYYLLHQDITGNASPPTDVLLSLAKTVKDGLNRIEQENTVDNDPSGEVVKSKMALVYENSVVDRFFGLLKSVTQYSVEDYNHSKEQLEKEIRQTSDKIEYDHFAKRLIFHGVMTETVRDNLKKLSIVSAEFKTAIDDLYSKGQQDFTDFFQTFPELKRLYNTYVSSTGKNESEKMEEILEDFVPTLKKRLKQLFVKQTFCPSLDVDLLMINELLENHFVLHSLRTEDKPLIEDFLDIEAGGTSAQYFFADEIESGAKPDRVEPFSGNIDFNTGEGNNHLPSDPDNPGSKISAVWKFFIDPPINENYNIYIETDPDAEVEVSINEKQIQLVHATHNGVWSNKKPIVLQPGNLYKIRLQITKVKDKAILKWASKGIGKVVIPINYLYPYKQIQNFDNSYIRLLKAIGIIERLAIREKEISFFSTNKEYQIDEKGLLNSIPVNKNPPENKTKNLFNKLIGLVKYVSLKESLNIKDEILASIFENPNAVDDNGERIILKATNWDESFLSSILDRFRWKLADIELSKFLRISEAFEIVKKFGVNADSLLTWTTNSPSRTTIHEVKNILRSKYDESGWLDALQRINDPLRSSQRNALVSYILYEMQKNDTTKKINTPDKLFEYFLIDVQMDPCMKTSRIKQAISTTQLFIQRCLMNLEPLVAASSIKKNQWERLHRYRVSEATKKIFLYPENWLEPELRDLKSPFFKELEGELLQADMNDELAETAMLNYLEKLDDVSKLEICAMYLEEIFDEINRNKIDEILHVFGRTSTGASRKYYYRRLEQGYWSAWKNINSEIEGDPILPVVWKNRLFLFWLSIVSKASNEAPLPSEDSDREVATLKISEVNYGGKTSFEANLCWSEYYNNKWQPKKTSDLNYPIIIPPVPQVFTENGPPINKPSLLRDIIQLTSIFHDDGSLEVGVNYLGLGRFATSLGVSPEAHSFMMRSFILNDTKSALQTVLNLDEPGRPLPISFPVRGMPRSSGRGNAVFPYFMIGYQLNSTTEGHSHQPLGADVRNQIVTNTDWAPVTNVVELPFYYQNENHVFLVKPEENPVTIHNYEYVFTDRGIFGQDMAIDKIKFPEIWEKPEITKPLPGLFDALMIPGTTLDTRTGGSKPIDFWDTDYPLNKVICDSKPIFYGNIAIGPLGSKNARLLCSNKIGIDSEFEIASTEKETQK